MSGSDVISPDDEPGKKKVGYRNPPEKHQFVKGASGNPKGRPQRGAPEKDRPRAPGDDSASTGDAK